MLYNMAIAQPKNREVYEIPLKVYDFNKYIKISKAEHNFGNLPLGPAAATEFTIKNISKEPIVIKNVVPSCGCTIPTWTKEPILPGQTGIIKAVYNTENRPGNFNKSLVIETNRGKRSIIIKGNVVDTNPANKPTENTTNH